MDVVCVPDITTPKTSGTWSAPWPDPSLFKYHSVFSQILSATGKEDRQLRRSRLGAKTAEGTTKISALGPGAVVFEGAKTQDPLVPR
jgi:hypothetical protein